jgi:phage terminase large subunit GpA-like protein
MTTPLASLMAAVIRRSFAPPSKMTVSEWANTHGWIARSSGASESGGYSTDRAPYMREILDVMGDEIHQDVVFNKPAQCGFTEGVNQFVGFCMAEDPSGLIVIQPDVEMAKAWMKERVDPMLAESPRLRGIVRAEGGRRTSDDTMQRKVYLGGYLVAIGANSPSKLRSRPTRRVIGDERSGWTLDARAQGDPWDLAAERTATFWNAKRIQGSTPGEEGTCPITAALADSDLRRYHVACPACGFAEPFQWRADDGTYRLVCDRDAANQLVANTARYLCTACGVLIPESEKPRMTRDGEWIATYPNRAVAGFDLMNSLVSPWRTWAQIMTLWRDAQGNHERLKVFVTHVLAQPWRPVSERINVHALTARQEPLPEAPESVAILTGAIDVQSNRVETIVVGWAADEEAYVFDWQQHEGDPTTEDPWTAAWDALTTPYGAPLRAVAIDTGFLTSTAWQHVDRWNMRNGVKVFGVKGEDGRGRAIIRRPTGARRKGERPPWLVGVDSVKDLLALRLPRTATVGGTGMPGAIHFAETLDQVFFDQLTAEELKTVIVKGRPMRAWRPIAGRRNEALDLFVYSLAALHALGPRTIAALATMAASRRAASTPIPIDPNTSPAETVTESETLDFRIPGVSLDPPRSLRQQRPHSSGNSFAQRGRRDRGPWKIRP